MFGSLISSRANGCLGNPSRVLLLAVLTLALQNTPRALACELIDGNSQALVDSTSDHAMYSWTVDGVSELYRQNFWYRTGSSGTQTPVYYLNNVKNTQTSANSATTENANNKLDFTTTYTLEGGSDGSGSATILESFTVKNLSASAVDLHLFQYVDFDLDGSYEGDTLQLGKTGALFTSAAQSKGDVVATETLGVAANHGEVGLDNLVYNQLASSHPITLTDTTGPVGPGDAAYAFEWDVTLAGDASFTITLQKSIQVVQTVPEPSALALASLGLVSFIWRRRSSKS